MSAATRWTPAEGHAGMDDMGEHATGHDPISEAELDVLIADRRRDARADMLSSGRCTGRPRLGPLQSIERRLINSRRPSFAWAAVVALSVLCFVQQVWR